jgi:hypothetical protein
MASIQTKASPMAPLCEEQLWWIPYRTQVSLVPPKGSPHAAQLLHSKPCDPLSQHTIPDAAASDLKPPAQARPGT